MRVCELVRVRAARGITPQRISKKIYLLRFGNGAISASWLYQFCVGSKEYEEFYDHPRHVLDQKQNAQDELNAVLESDPVEGFCARR